MTVQELQAAQNRRPALQNSFGIALQALGSNAGKENLKALIDKFFDTSLTDEVRWEALNALSARTKDLPPAQSRKARKLLAETINDVKLSYDCRSAIGNIYGDVLLGLAGRLPFGDVEKNLTRFADQDKVELKINGMAIDMDYKGLISQPGQKTRTASFNIRDKAKKGAREQALYNMKNGIDVEANTLAYGMELVKSCANASYNKSGYCMNAQAKKLDNVELKVKAINYVLEILPPDAK